MQHQKRFALRLILLYAMVQLCLPVKAQTITFTGRTVPLEKVFLAIRQQTGYVVVCNYDLVRDSKPVSISATDKGLEDFIRTVLKDQSLDYTIRNKTIVISRPAQARSTGDDKNAEVRWPDAQALRAGELDGVVNGPGGIPLGGASVRVKGANTGTSTDVNGKFRIRAQPGQTLMISFVGYQSLEFRIPKGKQESVPENIPQTKSENLPGNRIIILELRSSTSSLDETVVIGYGTTTQRLSTGNIARVNGADIAKQPVTNPLLALSGRVPGVYVQQSSGLPGAGASITIRGQNSIGAGNDPLYIIDGVPFSAGTLTQAGAASNASPFNSINPADIESIDILKDADATAIYGSRAANGVILITTRKGRSGKTSLDLNSYSGTGRITRSPKMLTTPQYLDIRHKAFTGDGETPDESTAPDLLVWDTTKSTDYNKNFLGGTSHLTDANMSLSGGDKRTRFLFSGNLHRETGVFPVDQGYTRGGGHISLDHTSLDKKFFTSFTASFTTDDTKSNTSDITSLVYALPPNFPLYVDGKVNWLLENPLAYLLQAHTSTMRTLVSNAVFRYEIRKGLFLKTSAGYSSTAIRERTLLPATLQNPVYAPTNDAQFGDKQTSGYIVEPQADYTVYLGQGKLNAILGGTWQQNLTEGNLIDANDFATVVLMKTPAAARKFTILPTHILYKYQSVFGRVNYNWQNKYIVNATFRRDGSTRFGSGKRYGNFWAVGGAWLFSNETLIKDNWLWLGHGKIRGSYAVVGNDQIADYGYLSTYSTTTNPYNGTPGLAPTRISNPDYSWEVSRKLEAAIELSFLDERIFFSAAWFRNRCGNQLVDFPLSPQSGFSSYQANLPALVQNTGWEFVWNTNNIRGKKLTWTSSFNLTIPHNKLVAFPNLAGSAYVRDKVVGQPLHLLAMYKYTGIDPTTGAAGFKDVIKDGVLQFGMAANGAGDQVGLTNDPLYYGGLNNSLTFKQWQLDIFFQYVHKKDFSSMYQLYYTPYGSMAGQPAFLLNSPFTPSTTPGVPAYDSYNYLAASDASLSDASYWRLKNISLTYSLPAALTNKVKMTQCRLYLRAQNLFTITRYKGYDPETSTFGLVTMPPLRVITAGIQCSF